MDIKTKNSGKTFYQIDPQLATILLELGMVERVNNTIAPPAPPQPRWGVSLNAGGNTCIVYSLGAATNWFDGDPDDAPTGFQTTNWMGKVSGPETPANICELYKAQLQPHDWRRINMMNVRRKR